MKSLGCGLVLFAACCVSPSVARAATVADFFSNCGVPSANIGHTLIVDPAGGHSGTFSTIAAALEAAKAGDTIALMTGDYGDLAISGINQNGFITIAAAAGQSPRFTKVNIGGFKPASHWRLTGLTVSSFYQVADKRAQTSLVMVGNSDNIIIEKSNLNSTADAVDWPARTPTAASPIALSNGISARQSSCVSIVENHLRNLFNGIDFGGDQVSDHGKYFLISGNTIDNFAGDGIDHYGSHVRIERNRITNGHDICNNQCVHSDGIQGWNYNRLPLINSDIVIDANVIIAQTTPSLPMPVDTLQGITIFDGRWDGVRISNNLIVTNAWHGITICGTNNASIINNTVAPTNPARSTWIMTNVAKGDPPGTSYKIVVRNNALAAFARQNASTPLGVVTDHNITLRDADGFADAFVKFDPEHFVYDLHPSRRSPAIAAGSLEDAPTTDIEGHLRHAPIDVGAYSSGN